MKRYSIFLRSLATISLPILFVVASLFSYSLAYAEEIIPEETEVIEEVLETPETITPENPEQEILEDENLEEEVSEEEDFVPELMQLLNTDLPSDEQGGSENFDTPACTSGDVYVQLAIPDSLVAVLGTGEVVQNGEWFLVLENGVGFTESEWDVTIDHDISIIRRGTTIFINVGNGVVDGEIVADQIKDSLTLVGGTVVSSNVFSGNVVVVDFEPEECEEEDVCSVSNGPTITSILTETVTIGENTSLTVDEIFNLFGIVVEDLDGEGLVIISSDLDLVSYKSEGVYTFTVTFTDNEDCTSSQTLTLVVEGDDDSNDDNGGGGSSGGKKKNKPQGEVLGATTCTPYLRTFMQMGEPNLKEDVEKLQIFLNNYMKENLVVDGVYGPETFEAVKRFQMQEFDEILKPWYITEPTGIVRETTTRHINNIMCPELNIQMPILYCATTGNLIYPDGTVLDPEPEYILYNGKPVIKKKVIIPEALLRTLEK